MSKDKTTPETDDEILITNGIDTSTMKLRISTDGKGSTFDRMLICLSKARISERTRIMDEGKAGLPDKFKMIKAQVTKAKSFGDELSVFYSYGWSHCFDWFLEQASLILSSQRIEAERKAKAFAEWTVLDSNCDFDPSDKLWHGDRYDDIDEKFTTSELYTIFETWYGEQKKEQEEKK